MVRRSKFVFFIFLTLPVSAFSKSLRLGDLTQICTLMNANSVPLEWSEVFQKSASDVLGAQCHEVGTPVQKPFEEIKHLSNDRVFAFWLNKEEKTDELRVRAFDLASRLQWGQFSVRLDSLSMASATRIVSDSLKRLVAGYPFLGYVEGGQYVVWLQNPGEEVEGVYRDPVIRDAFLPVVRKWPTKPVKNFRARIIGSGSRQEWQWILSPQGTSARVWLKRREK